ncbi:unnamed protein product [Clonostachys rosea]|uniref:Nonsense-mediated mRNA decay factor n=1 Tax=Bionectria ochroleuca TaxID=29856 RepID=A0ABY6UB31_BIOOC|nr:unnamed protein product [Clonostachys rosea]
MATPGGQAKQAWHAALKLRKHLTKQIEKLRADSSSSGTNVSHFDAISESLEQFRLACVSTIFLDFEFAVSETSEDILWQVHSTINSEFRRVLGKLRNNNSAHVVERRRVETKYNQFLRIAQQFYMGYIQRLSARYDVRELKRVARGIEAAQMPANDMISPVSEDLKAKVLTSCHSTLIRLGDLARYRAQAKHKKSGYETALSYYSLAHDLVPDSGFAFHQMGIINLDEGNHLDVIYHFYRAWAVKEPHPNAKQNLEAKFKGLQTTNSNSRNKPSVSTPNDTFIIWFVRLQALFYKGEPVTPQHTELDKEVIHRLTMAAKDPATAPILFKMSLVNIAAYCISSTQYNDSKSETAFRFWQYSLDFNIRFIQKLCEIIANELKESLSQNEEASTKGGLAIPDLPTVNALLPILRISCIWLATNCREVFTVTGGLGNSMVSLVKSLATVVTLVAAATCSRSDLATCPYLLDEDVEIRGLKSFGEDMVPEACRTHLDETGKVKLHLQSQDDRLPPAAEVTGRMLDILRCAYFLAEDPSVPLSTDIYDGWLVFAYEPVTASQQQSEVLASQERSEVPDSQQESEVPDSAPTTSAPVSSDVPLEKKAHAKKLPRLDVGVSNSQSSPRRHDLAASSSPQPKSKAAADVAMINGLDDADKTVVNMLSPFIDCPSPESDHDMDETSYGMHSATANEIAQELLAKYEPEQQVDPEADPSSFASTSGRFAPMHWASWDPKSTSSGLLRSNPMLGNGVLPIHLSPGRSSRASVPGGDSLDDPFRSPSQRSPRSLQSRAASGLGNSSLAEEAHRNQLLQAFSNSPAPRQASLSGWPQDQNASLGSTWGPTLGADMGITSSSNFTNVSSLYQGTPSNGFIQAGMPVYGTGSMESNRVQNGVSREQPTSSSTRRLQMDNRAWNYNAKVLQSAFQGEE